MPPEEVLLMNERMRKHVRSILFAAAILLSLAVPAISAAAKATDEIIDYSITVDVNDDASLDMVYHIDWKVLDDSIGMLEWIDLGVPNKYHDNLKPLSDTIDHIEDKGNKLAIYLDRAYSEGETVSLDFSMTQDHMYQIDKWTEGETVYTFTPAWFDGMDVDSLTIRWREDQSSAWQPDCQQEDGYLVFHTSLSPGGRYTMSVTYPNDAFGFVSDHQSSGESSQNSQSSGDSIDIYDVICGILGLGVLFAPFFLIGKFIIWIFSGFGFGSGKATKKKITRTKIEYYPNCPSCGAVREDGKDKCPYCGRSMIKSREVLKESEIEEPEKYSKNGTFRYGSSGNTYIHVNVVNVPVRRPHSSGGSSSHRSSGGSSCASSCACACASSCACACACASSGRAGCSAKDFFKTDVHKMRILVGAKQNS